MNLWLKSILIGLGVSIIILAAVSRIWQKPDNIYEGSYFLHLSPVDTSVHPVKIARMEKDILAGRLKAANLEYAFATESKNPDSILYLEVHVKNLKDTALLSRFIFSTGLLQFWEVYMPQFIFSSFIDSAKLVPLKQRSPLPPITPKPERDSMQPEIKALLDSMDVSERATSAKRDFYTLIAGFPFEGHPAFFWAKLKDTSEVAEVLRNNKVKQALPAGARYYFGKPEPPRPGSKKKDTLVPLYYVKTYGRRVAIIQNDDIEEAYHEYSFNKRPTVHFKFNRNGARKWQEMTRANIDQPIAMVVDDMVISAPIVVSEIFGGECELTGDFTIDEAQELARTLKTGLPPARIGIISSKLTAHKGKILALEGLKWLYIVISFITASALSWFIFKTLKPT